MLGKHWRFVFMNNLGVDMDVDTNSPNEVLEVTFEGFKFDSDGATDFKGSETSLTYTAADKGDGTFQELTAQNNATDLFVGFHGLLDYKTDDASADGTVDLFIEFSSDGGTTWPSDAADCAPDEDLILVASLAIDGDGAGYQRRTPIEYPK